MSFGIHVVTGPFARRCVARGAVLCCLLLSDPAHATIGVAYQMLLGNPSAATADPNNHSHYLIQRDVEAMDYNDTLRQPNWASWHYIPGDSGSSGRGSFSVDTSLPAGFYQVLTSDYSGSGYDRGHLCPSGDRTVSVPINEETFLMSNMMPQAPDNNQGIWANLENYSRAIAASNEVLIICGPEGFGTNRTASSGQIPIGSNVWKIIVAVPLGAGSTLARITNTTRVIAVNIPNIQGIRSAPWQNYLTTVNQLQTNTGFTFFTALNSNLAAVLRAKVDGSPAAGITGFTPGTGAATTTVTITGTNFTGANTVRFNGQNCTFSLDSATKITATVPAGATTGPISVIAAGGLATSAATFTINQPLPPPPVSLAIALIGNQLVLSWPTNAATYALQQNHDLHSTNWTGYRGSISTNGASQSATMLAPVTNLFFRLIAPNP